MSWSNGQFPSSWRSYQNRRQVWLVECSCAIIHGVDARAPGPLVEQARLRDFLIPQRGVFAVVRVFLRTDSATNFAAITPQP